MCGACFHSQDTDPLPPCPCPLLQLFCCCACSRRGRRRRRRSTAPARWVRVCCSAACLPASQPARTGWRHADRHEMYGLACASEAGWQAGPRAEQCFGGSALVPRCHPPLAARAAAAFAVCAWTSRRNRLASPGARSKPGPARRLRAQTLHMTARMHCSAAAGRMVAPAGGYLAVPAGIRLSLAFATHAASNSWGIRRNESSASTPLQRGDRGLGPLYPMALVPRRMGASQGPVPSVSLLGGWLTELLWGAVISASGAEGC
jgi:hypothetical protein